MPTGGGPCFLGSIVLGKYPLGNSTVLLRDLAILPRGVPACLALSLAEHLTAWGGVELSAWRVPSSQGRGGTCLGELTLCQWKDVVFQGSLRTACLGDLTLCWWKVLSTGEACELAAWESALSAGERVLSSGEAWELPAWESTLSADEKVLSSGEAWELPACLGTACLGECTLCWWKSAIFQGNLWIACGTCLHGRNHSLLVKECYLLGKAGSCLPGRACTLCQWESVVFWGGLETACLGDITLLPMKECYPLGKPGNCLPWRAASLLVRECCLLGNPGNCLPGRNGSGEELCLPGKAEGKHLELTCLPGCCYLPACYLPGGKALAAGDTWELCQVIPPSFLFIKLLSFLTCLSLTLMNLFSLIFSMNSWHCW